MSNTKRVKQKLTRFFVIVVFLLILVFGIGFLGMRFVTEKSKDIRELQRISNMVEQQKMSLEQLKKITEFDEPFRGSHFKKKLNKRGNLQLGRIEYLALDDQNQIIDFHIIDYKNDNIFYEFIDNFSIKGQYNTAGYVVKNSKNRNGKFIFFKDMRYDVNDFVTDAFLFLCLALGFSFIIYLIGHKVIEKIFVPVEENIEDMKNFVHNAGHELKTPITVMDSNLQLLMSMKNYDEELVSEMKTELKNMNGLIDSLVNLSDISSLQGTEKNNLHEKVQEIIKHFSPDIEKKNITTTIDIPSDIEIEANSNYFSIFLTNLIKNAVKYNKQNGEIHITFKDKTLNIRDTGMGIDEKNLEKIWNRFYREQEARSKEGYGIGLSLVQKIATIYNWKLTVKSEKGKGSEFGVKF